MPPKRLAFNNLLREATVWLCTFGLIAPTVGQTPAPSPQAPAQPVVRVTTRLVQVNVIVQDGKGRPVADLTRDDFVLLDGGQQQKISTFSVESSLPPGPVAALKKLPPLPPNIFTNKTDRRPDAPKSVTVVLFDGLNTKFEDQAYARQQVVKYLQQVGPEDRVALYALGIELRVLHDFTSDTSVLLQTLARYRGRYSAELDAATPVESDTGDEELDAWLNQTNQTMADFYQINKVNQTCEALQAIANHVARIPGRKNLIWISAGFPIHIGFDEAAERAATQSANGSIDTSERRTFTEEMERVTRALNEANMAIYPVDARGLMPIPTYAASNQKGFDPRKGNARMPVIPQSVYRTHDTMDVLAAQTGGKAFYNGNDLKGAIKRAIDDGRVTYVLGYYPNHGQWDGGFRELKIQVKRPHLNARYRLGYFALPDRTQDEKERRAALQDAVWSPLEATTIGLSARVDPSDTPKPGSVKVYVQVDSKDITLQLQNGRWVGGLDLFFVQQSPEGKNVASMSDGVQLQLTPEVHEKITRTGLILSKNIEVVANSAKLRVVIRDRPSGVVGSLNIPLAKLLKKAG
jgi:VWFA-related protein